MISLVSHSPHYVRSKASYLVTVNPFPRRISMSKKIRKLTEKSNFPGERKRATESYTGDRKQVTNQVSIQKLIQSQAHKCVTLKPSMFRYGSALRYCLAQYYNTIFVVSTNIVYKSLFLKIEEDEMTFFCKISKNNP